MKPLLPLILTILVLAACEKQKGNVARSEAASTAITDTTDYPKVNNSENDFNDLNYKTLLGRLFDNPEFDRSQTAIWKPNYYERMGFPVSYDDKCHTNIDTTMYFTDREKRKCAVLILTTYNYRKGTFDDSTKIKIGDCHFCGVPIGIILLSQSNDSSWRIYKFEKAFTTLGYFGTYRTGRQDAGKISLKEIGDKWTCLSLTQGVGGNGGYLWGSETLYSIEEFHLSGFPNRTLSNLLSYNFFYSNVDAGGVNDERPLSEIKEENTVMKILKKKGDYYDIDLVTTTNGKSVTKHYNYSDEFDQYIGK